MPQEYIIGRSPSSPIPIPSNKTFVSGNHVKITIGDDGRWEIEDLDSPNGTYVKDINGDFKRVNKKLIDENSVIRLGQEGHGSFQFMAHRVLADSPSFEYEFNHLKKLLQQQIVEEQALESKNARNMKIVKAASPIALIFCVAAQYTIPGLKDDSNANLWISRVAMAVAPWAIGIFFGIDMSGARELKKKRQKLLTCPSCGFPLSDYDIHNMQCSRCKAK